MRERKQVNITHESLSIEIVKLNWHMSPPIPITITFLWIDIHTYVTGVVNSLSLSGNFSDVKVELL